MIYEELDLSNNQQLINGLNKGVETINYDTSKVQRDLHRPEVSLEHAQERCSEEALNSIQKFGNRDVGTLDCSLFKFNNISFDWIASILGAALPGSTIPNAGVKALGISGRIWYPFAGYMGWHTNDDNKGWKLYCNHSREGHKSFFRYQHPETKEVVTSWDKQGWNFRIFEIIEGQLLWHCIYSETDRISIGHTFKLANHVPILPVTA